MPGRLPGLHHRGPDDGDLETHLVVTDGDRTWDQDDLATVTSVAATDPTRLRLLAGINSALDQEKRPGGR